MTERPGTLHYVTFICVYVFIAWVISHCAFLVLKPSHEENVKAYTKLIRAANEEYFEDVIQQANEAERIATDPELKQVANYLSRAASLSVKAGIQKTSDTNTPTGLTKAFLTGLFDMGTGLEGGMLLIEGTFIDFDRIDSKYQRLSAIYWYANVVDRILFWGLLLCGGYAFFRHRKVVDDAINEHLQPLLQRLLSKESNAGQPLS